MQHDIDAMAVNLRDEMLSESILVLLLYLEPGEIDGIEYQRMEHELPEAVIDRAKTRTLEDVRDRIARQLAKPA